MQIQVNFGDVQSSDALVTHVHGEVENALRLFAGQVTRVEAHLRDDNGPKSGVDKRCMLEVRLAGHQPMVVEHSDADLYDAISAAAGKLERAVKHKLERLRDRSASA